MSHFAKMVDPIIDSFVLVGQAPCSDNKVHMTVIQICAGLFKVLSDKFRTQYNKTILSLQYHKVTREQNENSEECIGHLRTKADECSYKEDYRN